jgi:hydroxypyruvate reductase
MIWAAALLRVQPAVVVGRSLAGAGDRGVRIAGEDVLLAPRARCRLLAIGKAAAPLARAALQQLGERVGDALVVTKTGHAGGRVPPRLRIVEAAHPLPDEQSAAAGQAIADFLAGGCDEDLVLVLLSGGASALAVRPRTPLVVDDLRRTTDLLLRAGAPIEELNVVRKHLDELKGGGLVRLAAPARIRALALSDVIGDDPTLIASGPAVPDPSTFADALAVLARRDALGAAPPAVRALLAGGARGEEPETLKPDDPLARLATTTVIANGAMALDAAAERARELGYVPRILGTGIAGEARAVGRAIAAEVRALTGRRRRGTLPIALLWAGETTVTVTGAGRGGRNQELALATARGIDGIPDVCVAVLGTDGTDGPTDAAGGLVDGETAARARATGVDLEAALADNDSYTALDALGALIRTGPTGTHVNDIGVALIRMDRHLRR